MAATESLASGVPVIAAAAGSYPEFLTDGYNGIICRQDYLYEDVIEVFSRISDSPELLNKMSSNARRYAGARLSRERVLDNFDHFLSGRFESIDDDLSIPV